MKKKRFEPFPVNFYRNLVRLDEMCALAKRVSSIYFNAATLINPFHSSSLFYLQLSLSISHLCMLTQAYFTASPFRQLDKFCFIASKQRSSKNNKILRKTRNRNYSRIKRDKTDEKKQLTWNLNVNDLVLTQLCQYYF